MSAPALDVLALAEQAAERLAAAAGLRGAQVSGALDSLPGRGARRKTLVLALPAGESAGENRAGRSAGTLCRATLDIAVVISVAQADDPRGARALAALRAPRDAAFGALAGWTPEGAAHALHRRGGRLAEIGEGRVWWQDDYSLDAWARVRPASDRSTT